LAELALAFIRLHQNQSSGIDSSSLPADQPDIAKLITEELAFMAFAWLPPSNVQNIGIVPFFKREATTAVR